ncbi:hypothetical protein niasHS_003140 [Heterodera schachtii]|uniref:PPPDE domain-containing protein n=2 Tax=Heterodera TaxID=34509 RepID=A0ABD2KAI3_HETSC
MPLIILGFSIICAHFCQILSNPDDNSADEDGRLLSFNQIGEFIEAVKEPIFKQIITFGRPTMPKNEVTEESEEADWTDKLGNKMIQAGEQHGTTDLIREINSRINTTEPIIFEYIRNEKSVKCADQPDNCQEMVKVAKAQLSVRLLISMAKQIVQEKILHQIYNNPLQKARLCKWWYRFRYTVSDSAVHFVEDGIARKLSVLMRKPAEKAIIVEVFTEKFIAPYKLGSCFQACGINHRGVKVYGIEFHFVDSYGIIIGDKIRQRYDPAKGIKFHRIGYTNKSQWEVQKIFDHFNDFYMENEQLKEGTFSSRKYDILKNNCINFSKEFVEALLEGDNQLKSKHWPPRVLRQPPINDKACGFSSCFIPPNIPEDQQDN